ncbi:MAG: DUF3160 domain-containing protein [Pseudomonadales bacterium]|jgi:hypothetical protein|nr:DUF3160 domain-containing protein [Pseudomonadales bacterium]
MTHYEIRSKNLDESVSKTANASSPHQVKPMDNDAFLKRKESGGEKKRSFKLVGVAMATLLLLLVIAGAAIDYFWPQISDFTNNLGNGNHSYRRQLTDINNLQEVEEQRGAQFSTQTLEHLIQSRFTIVPTTNVFYNPSNGGIANRNDDWTYLYRQVSGHGNSCQINQGNAVFVSSDLLLHLSNRLFDMQLQYLENVIFSDQLYDLTDSLFVYTAAQSQARNISAANRASFESLSVYFAVALSFFNDAHFELEDDGQTFSGIHIAHADPTDARNKLANFLCPMMTDIACQAAIGELDLFINTNEIIGRHNNNALAQTYFQVMTWYKRNLFTQEINNNNLVTALNATNTMDLYKNIQTTMDYLFGRSNELNVIESTVSAQIQTTPSATISATPNSATTAATLITDTATPSANIELSFFNQPLTLNNDIFQSLTIEMAINNNLSEDEQKNRPSHWLNALNSLQSTASIQDAFRHNNWVKKQLNTYLGAYADTHLNSSLSTQRANNETNNNQNCELVAIPLGYIEPNLALIEELIILNQENLDVLLENQLIDINHPLYERYNTFLGHLNFFGEIIEKQIANQVISQENFIALNNIVGNLDSLLAPIFPISLSEENARSATITEISTGENIFYVANAIPNQIYVIISDSNGTRLTRGLVYNFREFNSSSDNPITTESWHSAVYTTTPDQQLPARPSWIQPLISE